MQNDALFLSNYQTYNQSQNFSDTTPFAYVDPESGAVKLVTDVVDSLDGETQNDEAVLAEVIGSPTVSIELIHQKSAYLLEEGLHPMLSGIELDPESTLPE